MKTLTIIAILLGSFAQRADAKWSICNEYLKSKADLVRLDGKSNQVKQDETNTALKDYIETVSDPEEVKKFTDDNTIKKIFTIRKKVLNENFRVTDLNQEEVDFISKNKLAKNIFLLSYSTHRTLLKVRKDLMAMRKHLALNPAPRRTALAEQGLSNKLLRFAINIADRILPVSFSKKVTHSHYDIFKSIQRNENISGQIYSSLDQESSLYKEIVLQRALRLKHPKWTKIKSKLDPIVHTTLEAIQIATFVAGINLAWVQTPEASLISNYALPNVMDQESIHIINETLPIPHLAVRIGDRVYSYGVEIMSSTYVSDYFKSNQSSEYHALQVAKIQLPRHEIEKLQRYLELQTGKKYLNLSGINDCASMMVDALSKNTSIKLFDALSPSPAAVMSELAMMKTLSDHRVQSISFYANDSENRDVFSLSAILQFLELRMVSNLWISTTFLREGMSIAHPPSKVSFRTPEIDSVIKSSFSNQISELNEQLFIIKNSQLEVDAAKKKVNSQIEKNVLILSNSESTYLELISAYAQLHILNDFYRTSFNERRPDLDEFINSFNQQIEMEP